MIQEWSAKKTCAIHSNSCDVHLCPPSHPPYHQKKTATMRHKKKRQKTQRSIVQLWMKEWNIVLGVIFLCLSVLVSINLKRLMSQVNHRATVSILGWFSLSKVFNPIFYAVHCASWRMTIKNASPFHPTTRARRHLGVLKSHHSNTHLGSASEEFLATLRRNRQPSVHSTIAHELKVCQK